MALTQNDIEVITIPDGEDPTLKLEFEDGSAVATLTITLNFEGDFLSTVGVPKEDSEDDVRGNITVDVFKLLLANLS